MSNDRDDREHAKPSDDRFDHLVSSILNEKSKDWPSVDPEAILAYLRGSANEVQTRDVQRALAASSEFQDLFLEIAEVLQMEPSEDEIRQILSLRVPPLPLVEREITRQGSSAPKRTSRSPWERLIERFTLGRLIPVAAAAVIVLVVFMNPALWFWTHPAEMIKQMEVDPTYFAGHISRGKTIPTASAIDSTAESAALKEFQFTVSLDLSATGSSQFEFDFKDSLAGVEPGHSIKIVFVDPATNAEQLVTMVLPADQRAADIETMTAWVLAIPSLELWSQGLEADSTLLKSPLALGSTGILTITYPVDGRFEAVPAVSIGGAD